MAIISLSQPMEYRIMNYKEVTDRAIEAAGGVNALARKIGIAQPSVSGWKKHGRIGVDFVRDVESITGIPAYELRPDKPKLFPRPAADITNAYPSQNHHTGNYRQTEGQR